MSDIKSAEFEKFDRVMNGLLAVPYQEMQKELEKDRKKKARKKRAKTEASERDLPRKSGGA